MSGSEKQVKVKIPADFRVSGQFSDSLKNDSHARVGLVLALPRRAHRRRRRQRLAAGSNHRRAANRHLTELPSPYSASAAALRRYTESR